MFFTGYYREAGLLLKQKKEMNWNVPFMGGDATNNPDLVKIAGKDAAAGFYFLSAPLPKDLPSEEAKAFLACFYQEIRQSTQFDLCGAGRRRISGAAARHRSSSSPRTPDKLSDYLHKDLKDFSGLDGKNLLQRKGRPGGEVYRVYKVDKEGNSSSSHNIASPFRCA